MASQHAPLEAPHLLKQVSAGRQKMLGPAKTYDLGLS